MLHFLNIAFFVVHNLLLVFNLLGWIWPRTRRMHLFALGATLFSWLVIGAWCGWGYCLCADWHFQVRRQLNIHGGESNHTQMLFHQILGLSVTPSFADMVSAGALIMVLIATAVVWVRQLKANSVGSLTVSHATE